MNGKNKFGDKIFFRRNFIWGFVRILKMASPPPPSCPVNCSADELFEHYISVRAWLLETFCQDPADVVEHFDQLLGNDEHCLGNDLRMQRRVRTEIRCHPCTSMRALGEIILNVPFTIETGNFEGRSYVLRSAPVDSTILKYCGKAIHLGLPLVEVVLASFYHRILVGFILENQSVNNLSNEILTAYICGGEGRILQEIPPRNSVSVDVVKSLTTFFSYLEKLYVMDLVHYNPAIVFASRSNWIQILLENLQDIEITCNQTRLLTACRILPAADGHPLDVEHFNASERVWTLFTSHAIRLEFAKVLSLYMVITLLLMNGRWLDAILPRYDLTLLYGAHGLSVLKTLPRTPDSVREILANSWMSKSNVEAFLSTWV